MVCADVCRCVARGTESFLKHKFRDPSQLYFAPLTQVGRGPKGAKVKLVRGAGGGSTLTLEDRPVTQLEKRTVALRPSWFPLQVSSKDPACSLPTPHPSTHHPKTIQRSILLSSSLGQEGSRMDIP